MKKIKIKQWKRLKLSNIKDCNTSRIPGKKVSFSDRINLKFC